MGVKQGVLKYQQSARTTKTTPAKAVPKKPLALKAKPGERISTKTTARTPAEKSRAALKSAQNRNSIIETANAIEDSQIEEMESSEVMGEEIALDGEVAVETVIVELAAGDEQLKAEIEKEVIADEKVTSSLVKADYSPTNTPREKLIIEYSPLIKYIAQKIAARLPANIELDDLISSGVIGLMDAIEKYDASRDNKFKTYAEFRIRGAILDELRAQDWVPRSVREKAKQLERVYAKVEQEKGRQATDEEVCEHLGINQEEFHDLLNTVRNVSLLSFDDISSFSNADKRAIHGYGENTGRVGTPFGEITSQNIKKLISQAIVDLPEKQRLVLSLYYYEDLNLKEIGRVLDVTESRVSQLHTQAVLKLKAKLRNHLEELVATLS